jgi:LPS-assembly lipoprotein
MTRVNFLKSTLIFLSLLLLCSCGFKPRSDITLAPQLHSLYLKTSDPYGQLARNLKQSLKLSGVHLVSEPRQANTILEILNESTSQQLLSVGGTQQTRQYNLILTVAFQLTDPQGRSLIPVQILNESRIIPIQSNQVLGGSNEANNLYRQMRRAIVYNLMNILGSQNVTDILAKKP